MSPDEIVHAYPTITLADVYAALAYYWDHRDEIEQRVEAEEAFAAELIRRDPGPLRQKLGRGQPMVPADDRALPEGRTLSDS